MNITATITATITPAPAPRERVITEEFWSNGSRWAGVAVERVGDEIVVIWCRVETPEGDDWFSYAPTNDEKASELLDLIRSIFSREGMIPIDPTTGDEEIRSVLWQDGGKISVLKRDRVYILADTTSEGVTFESEFGSEGAAREAFKQKIVDEYITWGRLTTGDFLFDRDWR